MLYVTIADLDAVLSQRDLYDLTDNLDTNAKAALLESINEDATGLVHGYLRGRYILPVAEPDNFLKGIVKDIMKYLLYKRRDALNMPDVLLKQYADTLALLKDIQKGVIVLDAATPQAPNGNNAGGNSILYANRPDVPTGVFNN